MLQDGIESDWVALGLSRSGKDIPIEAKLNYVKAVTEKVEKRVNRFSATDLARTIIMMNAMNADPKMVGEHNLVQKLYESDKVNSVTGYTFVLLAFDTKNMKFSRFKMESSCFSRCTFKRAAYGWRLDL